MKRYEVKMAVFTMMEAANAPETLIYFCHTTRRYNPKDSQVRYLHTSGREDLRCYKL
jgi:hypothetical protein